MRKLRISFICGVLALTILACNSSQEPSQQTGQEDGMNTLDSTPNQTSDTTAPGASQSLSDSATRGEPDGSLQH